LAFGKISKIKIKYFGPFSFRSKQPSEVKQISQKLLTIDLGKHYEPDDKGEALAEYLWNVFHANLSITKKEVAAKIRRSLKGLRM
jgi:hypothetical protein